MFDNAFSQICPSKHFKILVRINLNYKHQVLYSFLMNVSLRSSIGLDAASRAEGAVFKPSVDILFIHFLLDFGDYNVHSFVSFLSHCFVLL